MANIGIDILSMPVVTSISGQEWVPLVQGGTNKRIQSGIFTLAGLPQSFPAGLDYVILDASGSSITPGVFGTGLIVPFNCSITQCVLTGNVNSGSVVADIWKCTQAQFDGGVTHPTSGDSITGLAQPTIVNDSKYSDSNLNGWNVTLNQGDILWYNIISLANFSSLTIALKTQRTLP